MPKLSANLNIIIIYAWCKFWIFWTESLSPSSRIGTPWKDSKDKSNQEFRVIQNYAWLHLPSSPSVSVLVWFDWSYLAEDPPSLSLSLSLNQGVCFSLDFREPFFAVNFFFSFFFFFFLVTLKTRASVRFLFGSPFSSKRSWFVDTVLRLCTSHWNGSHRCPS